MGYFNLTVSVSAAAIKDRGREIRDKGKEIDAELAHTMVTNSAATETKNDLIMLFTF
jgi:hypothetical protein